MFDLEHLSQKTGSPAYIFSEALFRERAMQVRSAFGEKVDLCYSIKANPFLLPFIDDIFQRIEVCSPGELRICEEAGMDLSKVLFSGVNKTEPEVARAIDDGVNILTIESRLHLKAIRSQAAARGIRVPVLLRVADETQFGMDASEVMQIIAERASYPEIVIKGLHFFTGTQKTRPDQIREELERMTDLIGKIRDELGFEIEELEYGTGLAVDYFKKDADKRETERLLAIAPEIRRMGEQVHLTVEMGRFFAAPCGFYVTDVVDTKCNCGVNYAICSGGIHQLKYDGQVKGMQIPKIKVVPGPEHKEQPEVQEWTICGSLCTTEDILVRDADLPELMPGDTLVFHRAGAYSVMEGMAVFLSRDIPAVWLLYEDGGLQLVRRPADIWEINLPRTKGTELL